jgi:GTPase SAR1 family protein
VFGQHFNNYDPFGNDSWAKWIEVDGQRAALELMDLSSTTLRSEERGLNRSIFTHMISEADGVVLLYDVTSRVSFEKITNEGYLQVLFNRKQKSRGIQHVSGMQRFGCILVGNKADLAAEKRQVNKEEAEEWAESQGFEFFELTSNQQEAILEAMESLMRSISISERRDMEDAEMERKRHEVENKPKWQVWNRSKIPVEPSALNR